MSIIKKLNRIAVALGGFLIFVGIILTGIFILGYLRFIDFNNIENQFQNLFFVSLLGIGFLDLIAGFILFRRK